MIIKVVQTPINVAQIQDYGRHAKVPLWHNYTYNGLHVWGTTWSAFLGCAIITLSMLASYLLMEYRIYFKKTVKNISICNRTELCKLWSHLKEPVSNKSNCFSWLNVINAYLRGLTRSSVHRAQKNEYIHFPTPYHVFDKNRSTVVVYGSTWLIEAWNATRQIPDDHKCMLQSYVAILAALRNGIISNSSPPLPRH